MKNDLVTLERAKGVTIIFNPAKMGYNAQTKVFEVSERDVRFATTYTMVNPKTGGEMVFKFSHSTGPEFEPKTRWVYKGTEGVTLEVCNDVRMVKQAEQAYLTGKGYLHNAKYTAPNLKGNPAYDLTN